MTALVHTQTVLAVDRTKLEQAKSAAEMVHARLSGIAWTYPLTAEAEQAITDYRNRAHTIDQDLESECSEQTRPLLDAKNEIYALFKEARDPWQRVKKLCNGVIEASATARRKAQDEAKRQILELAKTAPAERVVEVIAVVQAAAPEPVKSVGGSVTFEWVVAETDVLEMVKHPMGQQYLIADAKSLARVCAAAKNQEHPPVVPGVKFERKAKAGVK